MGRIMDLCMRPRAVAADQGDPSGLMDEVSVDFLRAMNKIVLEAQTKKVTVITIAVWCVRADFIGCNDGGGKGYREDWQGLMLYFVRTRTKSFNIFRRGLRCRAYLLILVLDCRSNKVDYWMKRNAQYRLVGGYNIMFSGPVLDSIGCVDRSMYPSTPLGAELRSRYRFHRVAPYTHLIRLRRHLKCSEHPRSRFIFGCR